MAIFYIGPRTALSMLEFPRMLSLFAGIRVDPSTTVSGSWGGEGAISFEKLDCFAKGHIRIEEERRKRSGWTRFRSVSSIPFAIRH